MLRLSVIRPLLLVLALVTAHVSRADTLPDFSLTGTDGKTWQLDALRGKVVMLNFWAAWCAPCRKEMPLLETLYQDLKDRDFVLLAINTETDVADAEALLQEMNLTFPILWDKDGAVVKLLGVNAMPTTLVIDTGGELRFTNRGYRPGDEDKYRQQVESLLPQ